MTVEERIIEDHGRFRELVEELRKTTTRDVERRERLFSELYARMAGHRKAEERAVLLPLREKTTTRPVALVALEEHEIIGRVMDSLLATPMDDDTWRPKLTALLGVFEYHLLREEHELLPVIQELMSSEERDEADKVFERTAAEVIRMLEAV